PTPPPFPYTTLFRSHGELAVGDALARLERALEDPREAVRIVQKVRERAPAGFLQGEGEQVLGGDVRVHGTQLRVEHHDSRGPARSEEHTSELQSLRH